MAICWPESLAPCERDKSMTLSGLAALELLGKLWITRIGIQARAIRDYNQVNSEEWFYPISQLSRYCGSGQDCRGLEGRLGRERFPCGCRQPRCLWEVPRHHES